MFKRFLLVSVLISSMFNLNAQNCGVVINEIAHHPYPSKDTLKNSVYHSGGSSKNSEWIELYNTNSCDTIDISCWILGSNETDSTSNPLLGFGIDKRYNGNYGTFIFPQGTKIPPLGFVVVGGHNVDSIVDTTKYKFFDVSQYVGTNFCSSSRWYLNNVDGWIALYNNNGIPIDMYYWLGLNRTSNDPAYDNKLIIGNCIKCSGSPDTLPSATDIINNFPNVATKASISAPNSYTFGLYYYRTTDGSTTWARGDYIDNTLTSFNVTPNKCNAACDQPLSATTSPTNPPCTGVGSASVTATDGKPGYNYSWSTVPSQTNLNATGLASGSYTVKVTDYCGCTKTASVTITALPSFSVTSTSLNSTCGKPDGSASVSVNPNSTSYSYSWTTSPSQTTASVTGLSPGTYSVVVSDNGNCTQTTTFTITTTLMTASLNTPASIKCISGKTGPLTVTLANSNGSPQYTWTPNVSTSATADSVSSGTYIVNITDSKGCTASTSITLTQPTQLTLSSATNTNPKCYKFTDGSVSTDISGGTGPNYTYVWTPVGTSGSTTSNIALQNAGAGTYTLVVFDANNCITSSTYTLSDPSIPDSANINSPFCEGDPKLTLFAHDGYTSYQWYDLNGTMINGATSDSLTITNPNLGDVYTAWVTPSLPACPFIDTLILTADSKPDIDLFENTPIPNVFTPNSDNKNDTFDFSAFKIDNFTIEIYNRWGKKVFESSDIKTAWDGKISGSTGNEGVYYWIATYKNKCVSNPKTYIRKGFVQLIR